MNTYYGEVTAARAEQHLTTLCHPSLTHSEKKNMILSPKGMRGFAIFRDRSARLVEQEAVSLVLDTNSQIKFRLIYF